MTPEQEVNQLYRNITRKEYHRDMSLGIFHNLMYLDQKNMPFDAFGKQVRKLEIFSQKKQKLFKKKQPQDIQNYYSSFLEYCNSVNIKTSKEFREQFFEQGHTEPVNQKRLHSIIVEEMDG